MTHDLGEKKKTVVLRQRIAEGKAREIIESKKSGTMDRIMRRPESEYRVQSVILKYKPYLLAYATYECDFYRKAVHTIKVDGEVSEVVIGRSTFPVKGGGGMLARLGRKVKEGVGMDRSEVEIELEEHVVAKTSDKVVLDRHGGDAKFDYETGRDSVEGYPDQVLEKNRGNVEPLEVPVGAAVKRLEAGLKVYHDVRMVSEKFTIEEVSEAYVPYFEGRVEGPDNRAAVIRIDAVTGKEW
ncbi:MAG: hypothetical protein KGI33_07295 [Thaumarchaeota archaeon]|nr:hypothetical protein [Nitrososphaerota archaeon]